MRIFLPHTPNDVVINGNLLLNKISMSKTLQYLRYKLILDKLQSKSFCTFDEIDKNLNQHDIYISPRTLQRDLETIRNDFGIEIIYEHGKGYFIDKDSSLPENIESFANFLEIVNTANLLVTTLSEGKDLLNYISFDSMGNFEGVKHLKTLLYAIRNKQEITFTHLNYFTGLRTPYIVKPYSLREFKNRWYLMAVPSDLNEIRTFGIDRIEELNLKAETFVPDPKIVPASLFKHLIGIMIPDEKVERIVLSFTPLRGNYVRSLKLHSSQNILIDDENEFRIELFLKPNNELIDQLLSFGDTVKVIEPVSVVEEMKRILKNTLLQYK